MGKVERDSNYELLRIVSMVLIVLGHILVHGKVLVNTDGELNFVLNFILFFLIMHVNLFMLITGYYQSKSTFKKSKVVSLILQIAFYNIVINSILKFSGLVEYSNVEFIKQIFLFNYQSYWFFSCYFIIYLLSPYLNKLIKEIDRKTFKKLLITLGLCFSILPFFTYNMLFSESGYTVTQFLLMYFIGAYIRKYEIDLNIFSKFNITQKRLFLLLICFFALILNFSLSYLCKFGLALNSQFLNYIFSNLSGLLLAYNNPLVIAQAVSLFLFFGTFNFKSRVINLLGILTFGVYLIHESYYIRLNLYKWIGIDDGQLIYGKFFMFKLLICLLIIYFGCSLIELFRRGLFRLISKNKCILKIKRKLCININSLFDV